MHIIGREKKYGCVMLLLLKWLLVHLCLPRNSLTVFHFHLGPIVRVTDRELSSIDVEIESLVPVSSWHEGTDDSEAGLVYRHVMGER